MAKTDSTKKTKAKPQEPSIRIVSENRKVRHKFDILDTLEVGVALVGSEVKSLRNGKVSLDESYARVRDDEVWLINVDIPEYAQATRWNHEPKRPRKLLMHREQVRKFAGRAFEEGLTLVPLKGYFNERGIFKVQLGLCKGRKLHDKREVIKKADMKRDIDRAMRKRG